MKEQLIKEITDEVVKYVPEIREMFSICRECDTELEDYKIIGRPTTLEDILIAVENSKSVWVGFELREIMLSIIENYHLSKPLHEQPIETLKFIRDILK